ncbi:hypothetical protein CRUP_004259 [Coryphaenoides rupestris]|nr:hypothetical protein CRUP_004259 [Coryphaenoides rupestris]
MSSVNVRNCIRFYQTAEELEASTLMKLLRGDHRQPLGEEPRCCCCRLRPSGVNHLDDLRKEDFSTMSAQLLYKMIKSKTEFPLH